MNRRRFLAGLGAAFATVAATTKLAQSAMPKLAPVPVALEEGDFDTANMRYKCTERLSSYITDPDAWYIVDAPVEGLRTYYRHPLRETQVNLDAVRAYYGSSGI